MSMVNYDADIRTFGFTIRTENCLKNNGVDTLRDLLTINEEWIRATRCLGRKSLKEVLDKVESMGLHLNSNSHDLDMENAVYRRAFLDGYRTAVKDFGSSMQVKFLREEMDKNVS